MNKAIDRYEGMEMPPIIILHEGHHDILDGVEDMDDIFGLNDGENQQFDEKKKEKPKKNEKASSIKVIIQRHKHE